ncbi:ATP-dependent nuclease [Tenacibaculum finnmarkense]|nr:AAA family ATPase [Tenacibaculum finnmarkense]MCG8206312.1 AAA family ATPase [Tenacibaculum finnmarkense genomovar finnmarkense]MCM8906649.1 AAA family ATPase [Tenacibaculum finnmarkense genomovar finnmarkense]
MRESEIRVSQIRRLLEKVRTKGYGKYLPKIKLKKVRGFENKEINFDFPVTAIVGPNGGGKTTVLGAAAIAYKEQKPARFFAKSGKYDDSMLDWKIQYEIIDKEESARNNIIRNATFKSLRWSRDKVMSRHTLVFGVSRTVPASERIEMRKFASNNFVVPDDNIENISKVVIDASQKILGKDISDYTTIKIDNKGGVSLLTGVTNSKVRFSEFHFGAGESSIIRMVMEIESSPENSLILIEEIENGLHPIATIRMVEYLIEIAERKKSQVIFTTHSNDAISPLPPEAIWASINGDIIQGKLDVKSLRAITGQVESKLAIFTEDSFATQWLESCISTDSSIDYDEIEVHGMQGDGTAVSANKFHNKNPSIDYMSICYIDGDSEQKDDFTNEIYRLPGESPESYIYDKIHDNIVKFGGELTVALHKPFESHSSVIDIIKEIRLTNRD